MCFQNFVDFFDRLNDCKFIFLQKWHRIIEKVKVTVFNLKNNPLSVFTYSIAINFSLLIETYLHGNKQI